MCSLQKLKAPLSFLWCDSNSEVTLIYLARCFQGLQFCIQGDCIILSSVRGAELWASQCSVLRILHFVVGSSPLPFCAYACPSSRNNKPYLPHYRVMRLKAWIVEGIVKTNVCLSQSTVTYRIKLLLLRAPNLAIQNSDAHNSSLLASSSLVINTLFFPQDLVWGKTWKLLPIDWKENRTDILTTI